jgi:hypothetical protein
MVLLFAAALVSSPPAHPAAASAQATATIRVLTAVEVKFGSPASAGAPPARDTVLRAADGISQPAKLVEFQ